MEKPDIALTISSPRLLCAVYFGLLSVLFAVVFHNTMEWFGLKPLMPLAHAVFLGGLITSCVAALYGKILLLAPKPFKANVFWQAFGMSMLALPVYCVGVLISLYINESPLMLNANPTHAIKLFLIIWMYYIMLFGFFLSFITGFAAIYLRAHLVYHLMNSIDQRRV